MLDSSKGSTRELTQPMVSGTLDNTVMVFFCVLFLTALVCLLFIKNFLALCHAQLRHAQHMGE